jgi:hypothetical protein
VVYRSGSKVMRVSLYALNMSVMSISGSFASAARSRLVRRRGGWSTNLGEVGAQDPDGRDVWDWDWE